MKIVCFIPARSGSKRIKDKNILLLNNKPLIFYTINKAIKSNCFSDIFVITDSKKYQKISLDYGAKCPMLRPKNISGDKSPDIEWVRWSLKKFNTRKNYDAFCILRPTNPFRSAKYIKDAVKLFKTNYKKIDSLRGISKCKEHPGKMWRLNDGFITPLIPFDIDNVPWHSNQYASLPEIYSQNASIEISKVESVTKKNSISGNLIMPYISENFLSFDINNNYDLEFTKFLLEKKLIKL